MASSFQPRDSPYWNPLLVNLSNNKLANVLPNAPTESSNSAALISYTPTLDLAPNIALAPVAAPAPASLPFTKKLFKQLIQIYIEKIRDPDPTLLIKARKEISDRPFKAKNPKLYFRNLHIDYFHFC